MADQQYLNARDTISGRLGRVFATINGNVTEMMELVKIDTTQENKVSKIPVLGLLAEQTKSTGVSYSGTATIRYVRSDFRRLANKYAKTGVDTYFTMVIENEDPTSAAGKQCITLKNVHIDKTTIAKLDITSTDPLDEEITFTFDGWEILQAFNPLSVYETE